MGTATYVAKKIVQNIILKNWDKILMSIFFVLYLFVMLVPALDIKAQTFETVGCIPRQLIERFPRSSGYGQRLGGVNGDWHNGIDYAYAYGTPILSPVDGEVLYYQELFGGRIAVVKNGIKKILFAHLSSWSHLPSGSMIKAGEVIGLSGNSGLWTTGPHLHYGLYVDGAEVNPNLYFCK